MSAALTYGFCCEAQAPELTIDALAKMCLDMQDAYDKVFAVRWGVLPAAVVIGSDANIARVLHLVDSIPEAPDALAYHTIDSKGRPVLRLGVETIRSFLKLDQNILDEVSKGASHEVFETAINPFVSDYTVVPGKAVMLAKEVCDPVQGTWWRKNVGAFAMSNFVLPVYFDGADLDGPWDYLTTLSAPLSCAPDGYQAWSDGSQTFGELVPEHKKRDIKLAGRHAAMRVTP